MEYAIAAIAVLISIWLALVALRLLVAGLNGAIQLFAVSAGAGVLGIGLYVLAWVVLAPVMAIACVLWGLISPEWE